MPRSPQIGEGTTYRETMEGLGLPIAWGMEGELGAVMADKVIPHPSSAWTLSHCQIRSRTLLWRHSHYGITFSVLFLLFTRDLA